MHNTLIREDDRQGGLGLSYPVVRCVILITTEPTLGHQSDNMEITFLLLAQTVIASLLITVAVVCWMYGDEDSKAREEEEEEELANHERK